MESCLSFMVLPFKAMQSSSYKASYAPNYEGERGSGDVSDCSIVQVKADWPFYTGSVAGGCRYQRSRTRRATQELQG